MKIEIAFTKKHTTIALYSNDSQEINKWIYDTLTKNGIDVETAIDCASWVELAPYGDYYDEDDFEMYISEE